MTDSTARLVAAAISGDAHGVESALSDGAAIDERPPLNIDTSNLPAVQITGGRTALHEAADNRHHAIVSTLLKHGADPNLMSEGTDFVMAEAPLHGAARRGDLEMVRILLAGGAQPKLKQPSLRDLPGKVPLQMAAAEGHIEIARLLLTGTDKATRNSASTAMHDAIEYAREGFVRLLLQHGVDLEKRSPAPYQFTPLIAAAYHGFPVIVRLLMDAGADVHARTKRGHDALEMAVGGATMHNNRKLETPISHIEVLNILLAAGCRNPNAITTAKNYLSMYAGEVQPLLNLLLKAHK